MTDEELRMRCLELAFYQNADSPFEVAETYVKWVIQNRYPQNKITFEKQMERKD